MTSATATALVLASAVLGAPALAQGGAVDVLPPPRPPEMSSPAPTVAPAAPVEPAPSAVVPGSVPAAPAVMAPSAVPGQTALPASGPACGARAARYATDKGFSLWVTGRGTMQQENPLRPLSPAQLVILQVVVNGRLATAYGPDYDRLQQGFSAHDLEKDGAAQIAWAAVPGDDLPPAIQVVADDGRALFGPMRFVACGDAPVVKATASPRPLPGAELKPKGRRAAGAAEAPEKPPSRLPQGALPGVAIPKGAID